MTQMTQAEVMKAIRDQIAHSDQNSNIPYFLLNNVQVGWNYWEEELAPEWYQMNVREVFTIGNTSVEAWMANNGRAFYLVITKGHYVNILSNLESAIFVAEVQAYQFQ